MSKKLQFRQLLSESQKILKNSEMWLCFYGMFDKIKDKKVNKYSPTEDDFWNTRRQSTTQV